MSGQVLRFDDSAHRAADEMLPWFVNGTLQGDENTAVEKHLRECARCRREVELLRQLQLVCAADETALDAAPSFQRLQERIAGRRRLGALVDRVRGVLRPWQRAPVWAKWAIAAEFAGIVMLAVRVNMPVSESAGPFQTLGAPAGHAIRLGTVAVVFAPDVTESELRRIVQAAGARVVDGPTESAAYVLEVPAGRRDATLAALRAEPAVVLAQPLTTQPDR